MSFTLSRSLSVSKFYTDIGISLPGDAETKDVIYTGTSIVSDDGTTAYVKFNVQISGETPLNELIFAYQTSGVAATLTSAETALKTSLSGD